MLIFLSLVSIASLGLNIVIFVRVLPASGERITTCPKCLNRTLFLVRMCGSKGCDFMRATTEAENLIGR